MIGHYLMVVEPEPQILGTLLWCSLQTHARPPRPRGHSDAPDIRTRHQEPGWEPARGSLGGKGLITASPGACGAPRGAGGGPDSPPREAQGTVLRALSPRPARRLLGRRGPLGSSLHVPAGGSAVRVGDFHICVQHHMAGRRAGTQTRDHSLPAA